MTARKDNNCGIKFSSNDREFAKKIEGLKSVDELISRSQRVSDDAMRQQINI